MTTFDPSVDLPTTPDELAAFGADIPDVMHRRIVQAIASTLRSTEEAAAAARNARQMALTRDSANQAINLRLDALQINIKTALANIDALQVKVAQIEDSVAGVLLKTTLPSQAKGAGK